MSTRLLFLIGVRIVLAAGGTKAMTFSAMRGILWLLLRMGWLAGFWTAWVVGVLSSGQTAGICTIILICMWILQLILLMIGRHNQMGLKAAGSQQEPESAAWGTQATQSIHLCIFISSSVWGRLATMSTRYLMSLGIAFDVQWLRVLARNRCLG